jgi:hypothetical protein
MLVELRGLVIWLILMEKIRRVRARRVGGFGGRGS